MAQSDITTTARYEGGNYFPSGSRDQDRWEDRTDSPSNNHREVEVINNLPVTDNSLAEQPFRPSPVGIEEWGGFDKIRLKIPNSRRRSGM